MFSPKKLILYLTFFILTGCSGKQINDDNTEIQTIAVKYRISDGWNISTGNLKSGACFMEQNGEFPCHAGSIINLGFPDSIKIKTINLQRSNPQNGKLPIEYKLYVNNRFLGRFKENRNILISRKVFDIRLILVRTGQENIIRGWDENYSYSRIEDTSVNGITNIKFKFNIDTAGGQRFDFYKFNNESTIPSKDEDVLSLHKLIKKPVFMIVKDRHTEMITEQIVSFEKYGKVHIYLVKMNKTKGKPDKDIYFQGEYSIETKEDSALILTLKGMIVGTTKELNSPGKYIEDSSVLTESGLSLNKVSENLLIDFPGTALINLAKIDSSFIVNIPYATTKNITGKKLYTCNKCFLRYDVIKKLLGVRKILRSKGFDFRLLDCYRPLDVQKLLYDAYPVKGFVADPVGGSIHNRGTAVDLTLTDIDGNELEMGSKYDEFSAKSYYSYNNLPDSILNYRRLLHNTMIDNNFVPIRMEWWHFEFDRARKYRKMNDPFPCGDAW